VPGSEGPGGPSSSADGDGPPGPADPIGPSGPADPFDAAGLRRRVLDAWTESPARFREDANAEEDLALGGYREQLLVELAQNAADAAAKAGVPGVLRLQLTGGTLRAANTGASLDASGVAGLASLRASGKRDDVAVGRFGVGFSAVLAVTDAPEITSREGGVRFSAAQTRREVAARPPLAAELARRSGGVPVLRLPWPLADPPPEGFTTEVRLPLRPSALPGVRAALAALDGSILLALPALSVLDVDGRVISRAGHAPRVTITDDAGPTGWHVVASSGPLAAALLADRPTEDRERATWSVLWAVPDGGLSGGQVVHAPTPSDEPLSLPVRLVASFPLGPDRRHVAPGPLTDWLVERCAEAYVGLVRILASDPEVLTLVPQPGLAAAPLDAALGRAILAALRSADWLPGEWEPLAARVLEPGLEAAVPMLADVIPGLLPAAWAAASARRALQALGVHRVSVAEVVEAVSGIDRPPAWWRSLYDALARVSDRDALSALPVPLADGRTVTGARGVLLGELGLPGPELSALDVRLAHADAVHPLLERLGGIPASPWTVLTDPRVRAQVEQAYDADDPAALSDAVLSLVEAAGVEPGRLPWLAELPLPGDDGESYPAGELLLPGGPLAGIVAADAPFGVAAAALVERWGATVLNSAGVLWDFAVVRAADVDAAEHDLDGADRYLDEVFGGEPGALEELVAVRDLEFVDPERWPAALELLGAEPLRGQIMADAVVLPGGRRVPSYTRWWLGRHQVLGGVRPRDLRLSQADDLAGLYDIASGEPALLRLLGCRTGVDDVLGDDDGAWSLLDRLADPARSCPWPTLASIYRRIAAAGLRVEQVDRVRVSPTLVVPAGEAVVLDVPYAGQLLTSWHAVPGGVPVADLLDLPLASELVDGVVSGPVTARRRWADLPGAELAAERLGGALPTSTLTVHEALTVDGTALDWWADADTDHVDGGAGPAVWGRALAWRLQRWDRRAAAAEALAYPREEERLRREDAAG